MRPTRRGGESRRRSSGTFSSHQAEAPRCTRGATTHDPRKRMVSGLAITQRPDIVMQDLTPCTRPDTSQPRYARSGYALDRPPRDNQRHVSGLRPLHRFTMLICPTRKPMKLARSLWSGSALLTGRRGRSLLGTANTSKRRRQIQVGDFSSGHRRTGIWTPGSLISGSSRRLTRSVGEPESIGDIAKR